MLPIDTSDSDQEGLFYLGYEIEDSVVAPVNVTFYPTGEIELKLESAPEDEGTVLPIVGLISPYYYYYCVTREC